MTDTTKTYFHGTLWGIPIVDDRGKPVRHLDADRETRESIESSLSQWRGMLLAGRLIEDIPSDATLTRPPARGPSHRRLRRNRSKPLG